MAGELPPGFQLDEQPGGLPSGFSLDPPRKGLFPNLLPQRNLSPQARSAVQDVEARPWGSGLHHLAYNAGEKVNDFANSMGASPEVSAGLGYGANVLTQAGPALASGGAMQSAASSVLQAGARGLMKSAIKPPIADQRSGDAARAIDTMLKQGYNPTKGGVEAMQQKISSLGDEVSQAIANSTATINKNAVAARLGDAIAKFKNQVNPSADLQAIEKAWTEFLAHPDLAGKLNMPVQLAQAMKQGTYTALGNKSYGELSGASTEAQKHLARGLKEEVSAAVPGVAKSNNLQGELINAKQIAERRALMQGNNNPVSLPTSIAAISHEPMAALGMWANTSSLAKSLMARMMYSSAERVPQAVGSGVGAAAMAGSGKAPTEQELIAEALRKKRKPAPTPMQEQFLSPEDASIPLAYR